MEQTKALNALEPFIALSKSATSPRAAADLVTRATSAPNTYFFAELLQTPQIRALAEDTEYSPYLTLLRIFSHGTYDTYKTTNGLPPLSEAQAVKLRQLSLMSIAPDRSKLTYHALQTELGLSSVREVENLVISAIYAGLVDATLDPAREVASVTRIAPLRDPRPGSIPALSAVLTGWGEICSNTLVELEGQIRRIQDEAAMRGIEKGREREKLEDLVDGSKAQDGDMLPSGKVGAKGPSGKPGVLSHGMMDIDEPSHAQQGMRPASKRKM